MIKKANPSLYQVNTRVWLTSLSLELGRPAKLDDIPDAELDKLADKGFDWVWFLSVWKTGLAGRKISRQNRYWQKKDTTQDIPDQDVGGSGFAITGYNVSADLGGDAAMARLRKRLAKRGLKLMLDFVPNHTAIDHPWVNEHPEYFVAGTEALSAKEPQNYIMLKRKGGDVIFAHGRDPYFDGWPDTLQLDYSKPATTEAMIRELEKVAGKCDGVRCDMAMLILPDVFKRTWGVNALPFWPQAIGSVRKSDPNFCFMAEVYWDMEWTLQQQGFDYTYDGRLYERLRAGVARPVREHLGAEPDYQARLVRFLENHDEPRTCAVFEPQIHRCAAVIAYSVPGMRFFHQGQLEGWKEYISPHLIHSPMEPTDAEIKDFYDKLLEICCMPVLKNGKWQLLSCRPAWDGNGSYDCFIAHSWQGCDGQRILVAVNYAPHQSQCYLKLPFPEVQNCSVRLRDLLSCADYAREGNELLDRGLYLDMEPFSYHVFSLELPS